MAALQAAAAMAKMTSNGWLRPMAWMSKNDFEWLPSAAGCGCNALDDFDGRLWPQWLPSTTMALMAWLALATMAAL